jgi:hypothetical protein
LKLALVVPVEALLPIPLRKASGRVPGR